MKQERTPSAKHHENFCEFCQRELPKKRRQRRNRTFSTSPYECEHCGATNDIDISDENVSESESEDIPAISESVQDTIRLGNPNHVIDHRTFSESDAKYENFSENVQTDIEDDESEIFWRNDSDFESFHGNFEEKLNLNDDNEHGYNGTVFLTETTTGTHGNRPMEVKMAWDDDSNNQFAEISRTIATDDGMEADDVISQETFDVTADDVSSEGKSSRTSDYSEKSDSNSENFGNTSLFPESESRLRFSPTPPSHNRRSPRNVRYGEHHRRQSAGEVHIASIERQTTSDSNDMTQSPIANRSIGLTRVALMRSRAKTRGSRSSPSTPQRVASIEVCTVYLYNNIYHLLDHGIY